MEAWNDGFFFFLAIVVVGEDKWAPRASSSRSICDCGIVAVAVVVVVVAVEWLLLLQLAQGTLQGQVLQGIAGQVTLEGLKG